MGVSIGVVELLMVSKCFSDRLPHIHCLTVKEWALISPVRVLCYLEFDLQKKY